MKKLILLLLIVPYLGGCVPLIAAGAVGAGTLIHFVIVQPAMDHDKKGEKK